MEENTLIMEVKPSWKNWFWAFVLGWILLFIPYLNAVIQRASLKLRIYSDRIVLERGLLGKSYTEIFCSDIKTITVRYAFIQRKWDVGDIAFASAGTASYAEIVAYGMPEASKIKDLIMKLKKESSHE